MSEAKEYMGGVPPAGTGVSEGNVLIFPTVALREAIQPLSDLEVQQLRQMLKEFASVKALCPIARKATQED
ncbi:hypothetical protein ABIE51_001424 [Lysobacter sp. OAE881]